jgi:hypothetical protein
LLGRQVAGRAVKPIQDAETRWWSTHSMCSRLMQLKPYLELMEVEGILKCNLSVDQRKVVEDICDVIETLMCAQRLMEGESYATISMFPYFLHKIRVSLNAILERPTSAQVYSLARKMNLLLGEHWGNGEPGTVAQEHITVGHRQRPKGIPKLA